MSITYTVSRDNDSQVSLPTTQVNVKANRRCCLYPFFADHLNFNIFDYGKQIPVCIIVSFHHFLGITCVPFQSSPS